MLNCDDLDWDLRLNCSARGDACERDPLADNHLELSSRLNGGHHELRLRLNEKELRRDWEAELMMTDQRRVEFHFHDTNCPPYPCPTMTHSIRNRFLSRLNEAKKRKYVRTIPAETSHNNEWMSEACR